MPILTITIGDLLVALGLAGYFLTGATHPTALIPTWFGIAFNILGVIALLAPNSRKHVMHFSVLIALIGIIGTIKGAVDLARGVAANQAAAIAKTAMCVLCLFYLVMGIRSFVVARRNRVSQNPQNG
jgi:hypothetical protein